MLKSEEGKEALAKLGNSGSVAGAFVLCMCACQILPLPHQKEA